MRHLLQVPIRARFSWEIAEDTRFFVSAGAYVGAYFANDWKQTTIMQGADYGKAFDWGVTATVGGRFRSGISFEVFLEENFEKIKGAVPHRILVMTDTFWAQPLKSYDRITNHPDVLPLLPKSRYPTTERWTYRYKRVPTFPSSRATPCKARSATLCGKSNRRLLPPLPYCSLH